MWEEDDSEEEAATGTAPSISFLGRMDATGIPEPGRALLGLETRPWLVGGVVAWEKESASSSASREEAVELRWRMGGAAAARPFALTGALCWGGKRTGELLS